MVIDTSARLGLPNPSRADGFGNPSGGDRVQVHGISRSDDLYGVIVEIRRGQRRYDFPLCELEAVDKKSPNYQPLRDYCVWFANR